MVGAGGWAVRKGRSYGTIIVDLRRAGGRSTSCRIAPEVPSARVAAPPAAGRGGGPGPLHGSHARAVTAAAPGALQVADRWHLLLNMRQAVERWRAHSHGRLRRRPALEDDHRPSRRLRSFKRTEPEIAAGVESRARCRAV